MIRRWRLLLGVAAVVGGCEGREVAVFEVSAGFPTAGTPPMSGAAGTSGVRPEQGGGGSSEPIGGTYAYAGGGAGGVTATAGDGGDPSSSGAGSRTCVEDFECDNGWLCEKSGCDAPSGQCVPWPAICPKEPEPVCGCDGVTYWNDCVRLRSPSHPPLASSGQCRATACTCNVGSDCDVPYASCSHLMAPGELCGHGVGSCWVLPPRCSPSDDPKVWRECRPPDQGPPPPFCVDTCLAIKSERPHAEQRGSDSCD